MILYGACESYRGVNGSCCGDGSTREVTGGFDCWRFVLRANLISWVHYEFVRTLLEVGKDSNFQVHLLAKYQQMPLDCI